MLRKVLLFPVRFLEVFVGFLLAYLLIVLIGTSFYVGQLGKTEEVAIYVQSNGVHTDICLPAQSAHYDWCNYISKNDFPLNDSFEYISIGWGDKGFFMDTPTWGDLTAKTAVNAVFFPSPTAMHVAYTEKPQENENRIKLFISKEQYMRIIEFVKSSFQAGSDPVLIEGQGYSNNDNFYEANGSYHLFETCNRWTNKALKAGNIRTSVFALFPDGILSPLKSNE